MSDYCYFCGKVGANYSMKRPGYATEEVSFHKGCYRAPKAEGPATKEPEQSPSLGSPSGVVDVLGIEAIRASFVEDGKIDARVQALIDEISRLRASLPQAPAQGVEASRKEAREFWIAEDAKTGHIMLAAWVKPSEWIAGNPSFRVSKWREVRDGEALPPARQTCPTHGQTPNAWGCPECVREMRAKRCDQCGRLFSEHAQGPENGCVVCLETYEEIRAELIEERAEADAMRAKLRALEGALCRVSNGNDAATMREWATDALAKPHPTKGEEAPAPGVVESKEKERNDG